MRKNTLVGDAADFRPSVARAVRPRATRSSRSIRSRQRHGGRPQATAGLHVRHGLQDEVDGKDAYEVRGKDKRGKVREVEVSATGEVLAIE